MNYRRLLVLCTLLGLCAPGAIAGETDIDKKLSKEAPLFERIKLRGALRDDVSRDVIRQNHGEGYQLRVVEWWPKKGVDHIEAPATEPRTWTIRPESMTARDQRAARWWPLSLRGKKQFKAHLLGFRGIGAINDPWGDDIEKPFAPAVVLRLPDGRKRCFTRGSFSDEDELYITRLYEKQMKVLRDNTFEEGITRIPRSHSANDPISTNQLYTPGTTHISSKHFTATLGSEPPDDGGGSRWLDWNDREGAARRRELIMRGWEDWWAYLEHGGHLMFYSEHPKERPKYKYALIVGGTKKDGVTLGRGAGGGYGASSGGDGSWLALFHEWGHGIRGTGGLGGGETLCDSGQLIGEPARVQKAMFQVIKPWKNLFWGWYPGAYAWTVIGDDPNWGYTFSYSISQLKSPREPTPMHIIARVGEKRGLFKDGIRETGDLLGQVGARFAEFDNEIQMGLRGQYAMPTRISLTELDREERRYRSDQKFAPEAFGVNLIRLIADKDARALTVDFAGHYDPKTFSDWRVCIVAVDKEGKCRYSPLWNKGKMSMKIEPGDTRYWLTVTATPTALSPTSFAPGVKTHVVYQGGFGYRYPYDVTLAGCRAGTPHTTLFEDDVVNQAGMIAGRRNKRYDGEGLIPAAIPVTDPEQRQQLEEALAGLEDHAAAQWHLKNSRGRRHSNGGGWVAETAEVAVTAYVGPHAMVLDSAKVLDHAVIEDYVIVYGDAVFKDNARAFGKLAIEKGVHGGTARLYIRNEPKWSSQGINPEDDTDAPQKRLAQLTGTAAFQANYECFQPEAVLLEDHYNERSGEIYGSHRDDRIFFDGVLIGNPGFTDDDAEGAFTFNGRNQWAELPGEMADLEVITLDMRLKVDSGRQQTVWMFGNDEQNRLSLSVAGGQWVLAGNADEVQTECRGGKVTPGVWSVVRAELDGTTMKLFQDGKNIARIKAGFRASDAFEPGKVRLATMAAGFGGSSPMDGAVDYFRILTEVYEDFSAVEVPLVNPRRLSPKVLARFEKQYVDTDYTAKRKAFADSLFKRHPLTVYYDKYAAAVGKRKEELSESAAQRIEEINARVDALKERRREISQAIEEARKNDEAYNKLVAEQRKLDRAVWELLHQEIELAKTQAAAETNPLEAQLLLKSGASGQLASISRKILDGNIPHAPDDIGQIRSAKELQSLPWPTTVDWDGRARYEEDTEAMTQPVMQHYLKRMKPWIYK